MGFFSSIKNAFKKVTRSIGKVVKKVVKGVAKIGKSIFKGVGKFMGKLGPIGTLAVGFIAPWAIGAMAGSGIPWLASLGKGVQAVTSTVTAPFKMAGQAIGKGISAFGEGVGSVLGDTIGGGFQSVTDKLASAIGYKGGTLSDNFVNTMNGVKTNWNEAFGTSFTDAGGNILGKPADLGVVQATGKGTPFGGDVNFDPNAGNVDLMGGDVATLNDPLTFSGKNAPDLFAPEGPPRLFDPRQADPFTMMEDLQGIDVTKATPDAQYRLETDSGSGLKAKSLLDAAGSLFGGGQQQQMALTPIEDSGAFVEGVGAGDGSGGPGGLGQSFYAQNLTGLDPTEELAERAARMRQSLLGRTA